MFTTFVKATAALARHLIKSFGNKGLTVAVTYDSRRFSSEFAKATASTFAAHGVRALMTKELRPVLCCRLWFGVLNVMAVFVLLPVIIHLIIMVTKFIGRLVDKCSAS